VTEDGLVIDLFAGAGGASAGVEAALERDVDVALNHNATALAVHSANHPRTVHLVMDVWKAKPLDVTKGRPVSLLWASPDCTFHSRARGGKPKQQGIRALPYAVVRWIRETMPEQVYTENVPELEKWGPLLQSGPKKGHPDPTKRGKTFRHWIGEIRRHGYNVEWRVLDAADYGAPTRRRRLFIIARRDGQPIVWPTPTHGKGRLPFRTAADCIDWSLPCHSIFLSEAEGKAVGAQRPLAEKTMWRIAQGLKRFVFNNAEPFILKVNHGKWEPRHESIHEPLSTVTAAQRGHALVMPYIAQPGQRHGRGQEPVDEPLSTVVGKDRHGLVVPVLQQSGYGERQGQAARVLEIREPLGTLVDGQKHALVMAWLAKHFGDPLRSDGGGGVVVGSDLRQPVGTVTGTDHHSLAAVTLAKFRGTSDSHSGAADPQAPLPTISAGGDRGGVHIAEVRAFLTAYYGNDATGGQQLALPLRTVTGRDRLGLVMVDGSEYAVTDITFRMLQPHELLRAQFGRFADRYDLSFAKTKKAKVKLIGNSVCPEVAEALVRANRRSERSVAA
jgi:DNA (cytosine-5)-methyltransferase 1